MTRRQSSALLVAELAVGTVAVLAVVAGVVAATVLAIRSWGILQGIISGSTLTALVFGSAAGFIAVERQ